MTIPHKPFGELSDAEKGALLLAYHEGKRIEFFNCRGEWDRATHPYWGGNYVFRIAPEPLTPDTINWEHVAPEFNFMARAQDGKASFFEKRPELFQSIWGLKNWADKYSDGAAFASYRRGTVEWQDSLVIRPGYEGKP